MDLLNLSTLNKLNETKQCVMAATVATAFSLTSVANNSWCCHPAPQTHACNNVCFFWGGTPLCRTTRLLRELPIWGNAWLGSNQEVSCVAAGLWAWQREAKPKPVLTAPEKPPLSSEFKEMEWKLVTLSLCHTSDWCKRYALMIAWGRLTERN